MFSVSVTAKNSFNNAEMQSNHSQNMVLHHSGPPGGVSMNTSERSFLLNRNTQGISPVTASPNLTESHPSRFRRESQAQQMHPIDTNLIYLQRHDHQELASLNSGLSRQNSVQRNSVIVAPTSSSGESLASTRYGTSGINDDILKCLPAKQLNNILCNYPPEEARTLKCRRQILKGREYSRLAHRKRTEKIKILELTNLNNQSKIRCLELEANNLRQERDDLKRQNEHLIQGLSNLITNVNQVQTNGVYRPNA